MRRIWEFLKEEDGPTAVEYAVMLALILMVCFVAVATVGTETVEMMDPGGQLTGTLSAGS
jgi:pilus assembly protein Flp/PilA